MERDGEREREREMSMRRGRGRAREREREREMDVYRWIGGEDAIQRGRDIYGLGKEERGC